MSIKIECAKVLAIDGPSGSGKSTVAKLVAEKLSILYIDTGAMYRALGLWFEQQGLPQRPAEELKKSLATIQLEYGNTDELIKINGVGLSEKIRQHEVSLLASQISQLPEVREFLVDYQRKLGQETFCVMEGRDIGTVVFPSAFCKIYLSADDRVRAQRRLEQLEEKGESGLALDDVLKDVVARDERDKNRAISPLRKASDAIEIDTTSLSLAEVINLIVKHARDQAQLKGLRL